MVLATVGVPESRVRCVLRAEMGPAQAKECLSQSDTFKGLCLSSRECNDSCLLRWQVPCWCIHALRGDAADASGYGSPDGSE